MSKINPKMLDKVFDRLTAVVIQHNDASDYTDENGNYRLAAEDAIAHYNLSENHLEDFLMYRYKFEKKLKKTYRIRIIKGADAFFVDHEAELVKKKVPQKLRVKSGLIDSFIGNLVGA